MARGDTVEGDNPDRRTAESTPTGRLLAVLALGVSPWAIVFLPGHYDLVFFWGWINSGSWQVITMWEFLFEFTLGPRALPPYLQAWPIATVLYGLAVLSASGDVVIGREDRRVTAGLLVLSALSMLRYAIGFEHPDATPIPVFVPAAFVVCWWFYADTFTLDNLIGRRK